MLYRICGRPSFVWVSVEIAVLASSAVPKMQLQNVNFQLFYYFCPVGQLMN